MGMNQAPAQAQEYLCLHCREHAVFWDASNEEWACPSCSRRFPPEWIDRQGGLTRKGPPVRPGQVVMATIETCSTSTPAPVGVRRRRKRGEAPPPKRTPRRSRYRGSNRGYPCNVPGLSEVRLAKDWTQVELADRVGVCHKMIAQWESGYRTPTISTLKRLAEVIGVSEMVLLYGLEGKRA